MSHEFKGCINRKDCKELDLKCPCIQPHGNVNGKYMILGIAPGSEERKKRRFFVGPSGFEVQRLLWDAGIDVQECMFSNVFWKQPPFKDRKQTNPTPTMIRMCFRNTLDLALRMPNLRAIITLGAIPLRVLTGASKITKYRGVMKEFGVFNLPKYMQKEFSEMLVEKEVSEEELMQRDVRVVPTYHPAYLLRNNMRDRPLSVSDFQTARRHAHQDGPLFKETYTNLILKKEDALFLFNWLLENKDEVPLLSADIETDSLNFELSERVLCIGFCYKPGVTWVLPISHPDHEWDDADFTEILIGMRKVLQELPIVGANFTFDWLFLADHLSIHPINVVFDVTYANMFIYTATTPNDLEYLTQVHTTMPNHKEVLQKFLWENPEADPEKGGSYAEVPLDILADYCGSDVDATLRIAYSLKKELMDLNALEVFQRVKIDPLPGVVEMQLNGICVSESALLGVEDHLKSRIVDNQARLNSHPLVLKFLEKHGARPTGVIVTDNKTHIMVSPEPGMDPLAIKKVDRFNYNAPWQVAEIVYDIGGLTTDIGGKTAKGAPSTGKEVIERIKRWSTETGQKKDVVQFLDLLTAVRKNERLLKTYVTPLRKWIRGSVTNRRKYALHSREYNPCTIHPVFKFGDGTVSARGAVKDPPAHSLTGETKRPIVSRFDWGLIFCADASQLEIRVLAMLTKDPKLILVLQSGGDPHTLCAAMVFGARPEDVTPEQRRIAKTVNFAIIYGKTPLNVAMDMGLPLDTVQQAFDLYFQVYTHVKPWMDHKKFELMVQDGSTPLPKAITPYGNWRSLPRHAFIDEEDRGRKCINHHIQSPAGIMCHLGIFVHLSAWLREHMACLIMETHDCAVVDTPPTELWDLYWNTKRCMETEIKEDWFAGVPIVVDMKIGTNWFDKVKLVGYSNGFLLKGKPTNVMDVAERIQKEEGAWKPPSVVKATPEEAEVFMCRASSSS